MPESAQAQQAAPAAGYAFLNLDESAFVETLVDHMVPDHAHLRVLEQALLQDFLGPQA